MLVKAYAPASLSNLGPGFDVLGLALSAPEEFVALEVLNGPEIKVSCSGPFGDRLPNAPKDNIALKAALAVRDRVGATQGFSLEVFKAVPPGSGLGSSGASAAAGVAAANHAFNAGLELQELLEIAADAETLSSGSRHLDNVAPSLVGGFVAVVNQESPQLAPLDFPDHWRLAVVLPHVTVRTAEARAVLPEAVPMSDALENLRNLAGLIKAAQDANITAFASHLEDRLALPYRMALTPYLSDVQKASLNETGMRLQISGSGPAVFAACPDTQTAQAVCDAVTEKLVEWHIESTAYVSSLQTQRALHRVETLESL